MAAPIEFWTDKSKWLFMHGYQVVKREEYPVPGHKLLAAIAGENVFCPICESSFLTFLPFGRVKRANAQCPSCDSLERHRLQFLFIRDKTGLFTSQQAKMLHIAPEAILHRKFKSLPNLDYTPIDKFTEGYSYPPDVQDMDILDLQFPENSFDFIICNHVLEHIPDDRRAMEQLYRVLKPGGLALLQVPLNKSLAVTYEDFSITDPAERIKHFGQFDHVRWYGRDYKDRLESVGFKVTVRDYISELGENAVFRYGLMEGEDIYCCQK